MEDRYGKLLPYTTVKQYTDTIAWMGAADINKIKTQTRKILFLSVIFYIMYKWCVSVAGV